MKSFKRIAVVLTTGFLAFAPPGTLIFLFMIILGLVGNVWLVAGGTLGVVVISVTWLLSRRRSRKSNEEKMRIKG